MKTPLRLGSLALAALFVAAACSSAATPSPAASTPPESAAPSQAAPSAAAPSGPAQLAYKGTITFWNTMRDFEAAEVQKLLDAWTAQHPGITVKMDLVPFDGADKKYETAANNKTAPDIMRSDVGWVSGFADAGYLADLTNLIPQDVQADFLKTPLSTNQYQGKLWGIPQVTDALGLLCNKQLLTKAGLSAAPTTWDELVSAGQKVTDLAKQQYGFYMRGDSYWAQTFTWGWGGKLFTVNDQGKIASVDINSAQSVQGWTYLKTKILGTVAPATWDFKSDYDNMDAGFKAGTTMCILQGPWQTADILKGAAFADPTNLVISPVPDGLPGMTGSPVGGHDYVVYALSAQDKDKMAAITDLLLYIDSSDSQAKLATALGLLPTRTSAYSVDAVKADPIISAWQAVLSKATNRAGVPGAQNIYDPYTKGWQAFLTGAKPAQQALDDIANAWKTQVFKDQMAQ